MFCRRYTLAVLPFALALAAGACGKDDPAPKARAVVAKAPDPWFMNPDERCAFDSTAHHTDPEQLVRDFITRDTQGAFFQSDGWFNGAVECPGRERSTDAYTIVADAEVVPIGTKGDSARVGVRYRLLGDADANGYRPDMRTVTETLTVTRSRFGWRLRSPAPVPHVMVDVAKKRQTFTRADQWALDAAVTQSQRLAPKR